MMIRGLVILLLGVVAVASLSIDDASGNGAVADGAWPTHSGRFVRDVGYTGPAAGRQGEELSDEAWPTRSGRFDRDIRHTVPAGAAKDWEETTGEVIRLKRFAGSRAARQASPTPMYN